MSPKIQNRPAGYHTVTPILTVKDVDKAIEFYKNAFGAQEKFRMPGPDGRTMHAEIALGDSVIMLGCECPEIKNIAPVSQENVATTLYVYVDDVDTIFARALKAGGKQFVGLADMFWGDRCGTVTDPEGHRWCLASLKETLSHDEIAARAEEFFAAHK